MNRRRTSPAALAAALSLCSAGALAQTPSEDSPASMRMRFDVIFRGVPRYVLTTQENPASADDRYWRSIALAPLQERFLLDGTNFMHGHVDVHLSAWDSVDLTDPTSSDGRVAGDVAVAWTKYHRGPWSVWGGRRFIPWGAPGGVHLDGLGVEVRLTEGLTLDALAGRPVTPAYGSLLGGHPGFDGVTAAGGARIGWSQPGTFSAAVSYLEHWAAGIPVRRIAEATFVVNPTRWLNVRGEVSWDLLGLGIMQADVDAAAWVGRTVEVDAGYGHLDPALLIPRWSILSVFVTRTYDEGRLRAAWRILPVLQVGAEGAMQHYDVPGVDASQQGPQWGSRVEFFVRATSRDRRFQFTAMASHRDDGVHRMLLLRTAGSFPIWGPLLGALEAATALDDDDFAAPRTSWFGRASVEGPVAAAWRLGASVDGVRSPLAASELRGMIHLTGRFDVRLGGRQ